MQNFASKDMAIALFRCRASANVSIIIGHNSSMGNVDQFSIYSNVLLIITKDIHRNPHGYWVLALRRLLIRSFDYPLL
jgi:hypothetical protein